ncbi:MAG: ComF family protein [Candidatus Roizmanbacteria bacterium]|nr:MAG: ComF family protein [Candidatus Roizmanbacteria bacterium]
MGLLKDLLFPKFCVICSLLGSYICLSCQKKLIRSSNCCVYCNKLSFFGLTHYSCQRQLGIDGLISVYTYNQPIKKIIKSIKYRLSTDVLKELFQVIPTDFLYSLSNFKKFSQEYFLQAVPLHPQRQKKRGFNQSNIIRDFFNLYISNITILEILERTKNTPAQAQIKEKSKKYFNVKGSFKITSSKEIINKDIILIDDIVTTGSTIKEACRILKKDGARKVFAMALARG